MLKAQTPQTLINLYKNAFDLWGESYLRIIGLTLLAIIVGAAPHFFIPALNSYNIFVISAYIKTNFIWFILYSAISIYFFATIFYRLSMIYHETPGNLFTAFKTCLRRYPKIYLAMLTYVLLETAGFILAFFPGVYLMMILVFFIPIILTDNPSYLEGLKSCFRLTENNWWRTFAFLAIPMIFIHMIIGLVEDITKPLWIVSTQTGNIWLSAHLARLILNSIFYPFVLCLLIVYLNDLKLRFAQEKISDEIITTEAKI